MNAKSIMARAMRPESGLAVLRLALAGAAIAGSLPAQAVEAQSQARRHSSADSHRVHLTHWTAVSTTAMGVTGDVELSEHHLIFNHTQRFHIDKIRKLTSQEVDVTKELTGDRNIIEWDLYNINIPPSTPLNNGNTMCGNQATTKVIVGQGPGYGGAELSLIFFSGSKEPFFDGWKDSRTGVCGSYGYVRN